MTGADPTSGQDKKRLVAAGYDRIAERYAAWTGDALEGQRARFVALLAATLPAGADVLDLGCATGVPVARALAERFRVVGVDYSARSIAMARRRVPAATFIHADMTRLDLPPAAFDAVVSFYAITHVPRDEHPALLAAIARWLRPGGVFIASLGAGDDPGTVEADWLGAPMFFSAYDAPANLALVEAAGLDVVAADLITEREDDADV
ncbi:MAG TPA: class I SAM-dependent methyltransferase, partial [Thermomicrobiales bacterium]|nr:class I SAM-dependent methyltransferase [Thermomicrobiales bacterium]